MDYFTNNEEVKALGIGAFDYEPLTITTDTISIKADAGTAYPNFWDYINPINYVTPLEDVKPKVSIGFSSLEFRYVIYEVKDIIEIVPNKVTKVIFADDSHVKLVLHKDDKFDIKQALYYAYAKRYYKELKKECIYKDLNDIIKYISIKTKWVEKVDKGAKLWEAAKAKERKHEKWLKKKADRQLRKEREAKKAKELEREEKIKIQEEAILRAVKQLKANQIADSINLL